MLIVIGSLIFAILKKTMITYAIIIANFLVFIITLIYESQILGSSSYLIQNGNMIFEHAGLGFRALYLTPEYLSQSYTLFTSMFLHNDFLHIFGNMIIFFFMGIAFEERIGWKKFITIYLITGVCGALTEAAINFMSPAQFANVSVIEQTYIDMGGIPMVGASGAIFGILGAFAFSYPHDKVIVPVPLGIFSILARVKVIWAAMLFGGMQFFLVAVFSNNGNVAYFAHLGGLASGFILAAIMIRGKTHTNKGQTIYHDTYNPPELKDIDFSKLKDLATNDELKGILKKIENETVPQVQHIWLEHFFEKAKCPNCKNNLSHSNNETSCNKCKFKLKF